MLRHGSSPQSGTNDANMFSKIPMSASTTCVALSASTSHASLKMLGGDVMSVCLRKRLPNASNVVKAVVRCMMARTRVTLLSIGAPCLEQIFLKTKQVQLRISCDKTRDEN